MMRSPYNTSANLLVAIVLLFSSLPVNSQDHPSSSTDQSWAVINDPEPILLEIYEEKSDEERDLTVEIEDSARLFFDDAIHTGKLELTSEEAAAIAGKGSVHYQSWWSRGNSGSVLRQRGETVKMSLDEIYTRALANSSQVRVFAALPLIRETAIDEAKGRFDPEFYAEGGFDSTHEPTGSLLETGSAGDFFRERGWTFEAGIRKRFLAGTQISLGQQLSSIENNSEFYTPGDQGKSRLKLSVVQPLLQGAGVKYNRTMIQIARLDAETGYDEFIRQLETHLMEVNRSYWSLYLARVVYMEKKRLVDETASVARELLGRENLDAMGSQILRTDSALTSRKADLVRSELAIRNAESRLRALVNDPWFVEASIGEIIPADLPVTCRRTPDFGKAVADSLTFRPEIRQAEKNLRAADLREDMARNDKRPRLDLIAEAGIGGLAGGGSIPNAYDNQYRDDEPSWGIGLQASVPWGRRSAKARHLRTQLEVRQKKDQLRSTMDTILLEVQVAHREVTTAYPDMKAKQDAAIAADAELDVLKERRGIEGETGQSLYLEKVLDAQERRARSRQDFIEALVVYNAALTNLDRAKGTLLQEEEVGVERTTDSDDLPLLRLVKQEAGDFAKHCYENQK